MYKAIQAFFKSENDAETAKADLNKIKANNIRVDHLPESDRTLLLTPLAYSGNNTSGMGAGGGIVAAFTKNNEGKGVTGDNKSRDYTIECEVAEDDYQEALKIIMENDGHMDKKMLEK
ncbi:hypothetical protein JCM21714_1071 [Gracilibacillus boraciitolerans JCM 21714]|uniref:Uncharacterized protein n=1 Tax=Gracilibacillus boraciitolerans JCM 21714 TaxID=1298598 RepID=W4VFA8_9BACI|nr:hypothetical protein [Gracilibacillus boraciitolerans]GAE92090.1 hypothetical protein JCM21714_1071 [Gracilibacillus boraciitolerans JCM 21714]